MTMDSPRSMPVPVSGEFADAVTKAVYAALQHPDDQVAFAAGHTMIYGMPFPLPYMKSAAGCDNCRFLGLWVSPDQAKEWKYTTSPHGSIFLFEQGIRQEVGDLDAETYKVLVHEIDHAIGRDHVLEALENAKAAGLWSRSRPMACG